MADEIISRDQNRVTVLAGVTDDANLDIKMLRVDPTTKRLLVSAIVSGSGLTVGTTTISSGTTTRILYNNAGVLGEYTISGSGTIVAMATAPTFGTSITGSYLTASEILITDADKKIVSAPVATYPSLTELSYVKGVTSAIQTQINAKAPSTSPTFATSITGSYLTASEILITDGSKNIVSAPVATYPSLTELTYLKGVTSAIQTQFTGKLSTGLAILISQATPQTLGDTTNRLTKLWATDIESTNMPTVGGTAILTSLTAPTFNTIELGTGQTDTTLSRVSAGVVAIEGVNILTVAGGTMTGNITLGENTSIDHDPSLSADGKYTGECVTGTAGATLAFGDLIYLDPTDSRWELADANAASAADGDSRGILGICVLVASGDGEPTKILLRGMVRADAVFPALTINAPVYVSETAGDITTTIPTTTDAVQRAVGFGFTADVLYFCPNTHYQTAV